MSRGKQAAKNYIAIVIREIIIIGMGLVSRSLFIKEIGIQYIGITAFFSSVVAMLSLMNLGVGSSIVYVLIPVVEAGDRELEAAYYLYSKKIFKIIVLLLFLGGVIAVPTFALFIDEADRGENFYLYYFIYLLASLESYAIASENAIYSAHHRMRVGQLATLFGYIFVVTLQIIMLLIKPDYMIYLLIMLVGNLIPVLYVTARFRKDFPYLQNEKIYTIGSSAKSKLFNKVKNVFVTRLSLTAMDTADTMLVSKIAGMNTLGILNNYTMIFSNIKIAGRSVYSAMESSLGGLNSILNKGELRILYQRELFGFHCIGAVLTACTFVLIQDFMKLFAGAENMFSRYLVWLIIADIYLNVIMYALSCCYNTSDYYSHIKWIYVISMFINIPLSIGLGTKYGVIGIFLGTIVSRVWILVASIFVVFVKILEENPWRGIMRNGLYFLQWSFILVFMELLARNFAVDNYWMWMLKASFCFVIACFLIVVLNCKTEEFNYLYNRYFGKIKNIVKQCVCMFYP